MMSEADMVAEEQVDPDISYYTHGEGTGRRPHAWRYLGRKAQAYMCMECELRVSKRALKEATDA